MTAWCRTSNASPWTRSWSWIAGRRAGAYDRTPSRKPHVMLMSFFAGCVLLIIALIAMDLGVFHRKARVVSMREALIWSGVWIAVALLFNVAVYALYGQNWMGFVDRFQPQLTGTRAASQFLTGYLLELS